MLSKNLFSSLFIASALSVSLSASAGEMQPFNKAEFEKAQAEGKTILVDFYASWCPTCKKQAPIIKELMNEKEFAGMVGFTADYDTEKELKKNLKVARQSTLVIFKGSDEKARATGITKKEDIKALFQKGI